MYAQCHNDNDNHTKVDQQDEQEKQNAADEALDQEVSLILHFFCSAFFEQEVSDHFFMFFCTLQFIVYIFNICPIMCFL